MYRSLWKYGGSLMILVALSACGQPATTQTAPEMSQTPVTVSADNISGPVTIGGGNTLIQPGSDTQGITSHGGPITGHVSFVDNLRAKGLMVEPTSSVEQPFFGVKGEVLRISGGELKQPAEVQSFEYPSADAAGADLGQIGPDGNPKGSMVEWKGSPHFFQKENLVVLYVGDDPAVVKLLTELLGAQVAGR